jgi:hypothetical protein
MTEENYSEDFPEYYLGIIFWADADGGRGVLAATDGKTYCFNETAPIPESLNRVPTYLDGWRPETAIDAWSLVWTEPTIVEFKIRFFEYTDHRDGYSITAIRPAKGYSQEDEGILLGYRANHDAKQDAKRRDMDKELRARDSDKYLPRTRVYGR